MFRSAWVPFMLGSASLAVSPRQELPGHLFACLLTR